jgi:hypothetical protein
MKILSRAAFAGAVLLCSFGASSAATNLIANGSFEEGFIDWTPFGATGDIHYGGAEFGVAPENGDVQVVGVLATAGVLQQIHDIPGRTYEVSVWYASLGGGTQFASIFSVIAGVTPIFSVSPVPDTPYVEVAGTFVASAAGRDIIAITTENGHSANFFDNVSVVATPEASTWAMMFFGFAGLTFAGCRKARAISAA